MKGIYNNNVDLSVRFHMLQLFIYLLFEAVCIIYE